VADEQNQRNEASTEPAKPAGLLYHYTDQKGLVGILESGCIWATHYRFLNDASERLGALDFFVAIDQMYSIDQHISPRYWGGLRDSLDNTFQLVDAYFVSFSEESDAPLLSGDRLSQWRSYALNRQGFSLGFQADYMKGRADKLTQDLQLATLLLPCVYNNESKEEIVRNIIRNHGEALKRIARERLDTDFPESERIIDDPKWRREFREFQTSFLNYSSQFKNYGFKEENEQRLVVYVLKGVSSLNSIEFRDCAFGRTPYIQLPLGLKDQDSPLRRIVVGPSQSKDQIVISLKLELARMGVQGVEVVPSQIPYRNW
jgi:hypothetical protein